MQDSEHKAKSLSLEYGLSPAAELCIVTFGCWLDAKGKLSHTPCDISIKNAIYDMFIESYGLLTPKEADAFIAASDVLKAVR